MDTTSGTHGVYAERARYLTEKGRQQEGKAERKARADKAKKDAADGEDSIKKLEAMMQYGQPKIDRYLEWERYFQQPVAKPTTIEKELIAEWTQAIRELAATCICCKIHPECLSKQEPTVSKSEAEQVAKQECACEGPCRCSCESCIETESCEKSPSEQSSCSCESSSCECPGPCVCSTASCLGSKDECLCIGPCTCPCEEEVESAEQPCTCPVGECSCEHVQTCACSCSPSMCNCDVREEAAGKGESESVCKCLSETCICPTGTSRTCQCPPGECSCECIEEECICQECDCECLEGKCICEQCSCEDVAEECVCSSCSCEDREEAKCVCSTCSCPDVEPRRGSSASCVCDPKECECAPSPQATCTCGECECTCSRPEEEEYYFPSTSQFWKAIVREPEEPTRPFEDWHQVTEASPDCRQKSSHLCGSAPLFYRSIVEKMNANREALCGSAPL